jgi:hypothetical protein
MGWFDWDKVGARTRAGLVSVRGVLEDGKLHARSELYSHPGHDLANRTIDNVLWKLRSGGFVRYRKGGRIRITPAGMESWPCLDLIIRDALDKAS